MVSIAGAILLVVTALAWALLVGALVRGARARHRLIAPPAPTTTRVALVIPCVFHERLRANLEAFASQRCGELTTWLVTAAADEPAAAVVEATCRRHPHCRHVVAGVAMSGGQKNHNLLAALAAADARERADVVVCCDDDCQPAHDGWLSCLVGRALLAGGRAAVTTFRDVGLPARAPLGTSLYFFGSAFQRAGMGLTSRYLWGGGMALARPLLDAIDLESVWRTTVVDDIALSAALRRQGRGVVFAPEAVLVEIARPLSLPAALAWMRRQAQFAQLYAPAAFWATLALAGLTTLAPLALLLAWRQGDVLLALASAGCLGSVVVTALTCALAHGPRSHPGARARALLRAPLVLLAGTVALIGCLFTRHVVWAGRRYRMARDGSVAAISSGSST